MIPPLSIGKGISKTRNTLPFTQANFDTLMDAIEVLGARIAALENAINKDHPE